MRSAIMAKWILVIGFVWCLFQCLLLIGIHGSSTAPLVLMISFDGFRWDYLDLVEQAGYETPNFNALIQQGSKAKWMLNAYGTVTFPNHYTLATGMYEENHGVINNKMFDPVFNEVFNGKNGQMQQSKWWNNGSDTWQGKPIWLANQQKAGQRSGVYYWIGSEAAINGERPYHYTKYNWSMPYQDRVDTVVSWLTDQQSPVNLAMLYFDEPDTTGHEKGPNSPEMIQKILDLDKLLGYLTDSLRSHDLFDNLNLIVTSDHGMAEMNETIYLKDYVDTKLFTAYGETPIWHILPNEGKEDDVYQQLLKVPHIHVYRKADIPSGYRYRWNRRIMPILVEAYVGTVVCANKTKCPVYKGDHGFNNSLSSMHPIFIARGPSFREGYVSEPFHNVDVYPLLCHLLGVPPASHDGNLSAIQSMLKVKPVNLTDITLFAVGLLLGIVLVFVGVYSIFRCTYFTVESVRKEYSRWGQSREQQSLLKSDDMA